MTINTNVKTYLAIFLIGVIVTFAGISVYGIYQRDTSQTPTTIYKGLTEAEEVIVQENIKTNIQQQKRKETKQVDKKQPSYVDNAPPIQNNDQDYKSEPMYVAPIAEETKSNAPDTETSELQSHIDAIQANPDDVKKMLSQFSVKDVDWGNSKSIKITSKGDLKKVISELKAGGNPKNQVIIDFLKNADIDDNTEINVELKEY